MGLWNNLKRWLGIGVLAGSLMLPSVGKADSLEVSNFGDAVNNIGSSTLYQKHRSDAQENYDARDGPWSTAPIPPYDDWVKIYTEPYSEELETDARPIDSESIFQANLSAVTLGSSISGTNQIFFFWGSR